MAKSVRFWLALGLMLQMLPATLLTPAVRPLFSALHAGRESAMHAFMSLNMLGAALFAPWLGRKLDALPRRRHALAGLCLIDACLLVVMCQPLPTWLVLGLRMLEGGAHVGAATLLLAEGKRVAERTRDPSVMGIVGMGIMLAVAFGNVIGAFLVGLAEAAPFYAGALAALVVAAVGPRLLSDAPPPTPRSAVPAVAVARALALPITAGFVSRFTIGCLVVSFALFAHRAHGLTDRAIGGLFACMTVPFAALTYPASRLLARMAPALLLGASVLGYALLLVVLAFAPSGALPWVMAAAGVLSASSFAATLHYAAASAPAGAESRAMAFFNAGGCIGMLLGPAAAGITIALLKPHVGDIPAYRGAFLLAASAVLVWLASVAGRLLRHGRLEHAERAARRLRPHPG
jgi:MFS family permease